MSIFPVVKAESVSLLVAKESSLGTQPTSGWQTLQPNPDGIGDYYPKIKTVAPAPLTVQRQLEAPQIVDLDAAPKIKFDLTKDHTDAFIEGSFLARAKHSGGTGVAYFTPTARTTTAFTVTAGGALQAGTIVVPRGFITGTNVAQNATPLVVGVSSTATSVVVAAGAAETVSGYVTTLEVGGFQFTSGDLGIDVNGNLTTATADFTTMGLNVGQEIWLGGGAVGGAMAFATAAYRGFAEVAAIAANLLTLRRRAWTVAAADPGTGKTVHVYWSRWLRDVAFTHADYLETSYQFELAYPNLSAGVTNMYAYAAGNLVDQLMITAPAANLLTAEVSFIGTTVGDPTVTRATGASTAAAVLAIGRYNTVSNEPYLRLLKQSDESIVSDDIDTWALTLMNHVSPQKQQGTLGTKRDVVGTCEVAVSATAFITQADAMLACSANTTLMLGAGFRNGDGGIFFNVPSLKCTDAPPKFPKDGPVTADLKLGAFRDATLNYTLGVSLFAYLPSV